VAVYADGQPVERERHTVDWEADAAAKGGYAHYMLKEIHEQPRALRQTLSGRIDSLNARADLELDLPDAYLDSLEEVQIVAARTSYHAGLYARRLVEAHADVRVTVEVASEYAFDGGWVP
jgi:glucosamine--fructose-6-phosphate aminotransferase (isomerizing)